MSPDGFLAHLAKWVGAVVLAIAALGPVAWALDWWSESFMRRYRKALGEARVFRSCLVYSRHLARKRARSRARTGR